MEGAAEEEVRRRRRMELKGAGAAEARRGSKHGPVEGEAGGSLDWAGEAAERTCRDGTGAGEEVRRWVLWRGVAAVAGRSGHGQEEEGAGWSCDGVVVEEVHLWMEVEVEEEEQDLERITGQISHTKRKTLL